MAKNLASIHLVKYSTATTAKRSLPSPVGSGPNRSIRQRCRGQVGLIRYVVDEGLVVYCSFL